MAILPESMMLNEVQRLELEQIKAQAARKIAEKRCIRCGGVIGRHPKAKDGIRQCPYCFMNYSSNALPYELSWAFEEEFRKNIKLKNDNCR